MGKRFYKIRNINLRRRPGYSWIEDVTPALMHSDTCLDIEIILGSA